jgi:hypothetical protein
VLLDTVISCSSRKFRVVLHRNCKCGTSIRTDVYDNNTMFAMFKRLEYNLEMADKAYSLRVASQ